MPNKSKLIFDSTISSSYSSSTDSEKMMAKLKANSLRIVRVFQIALRGWGFHLVGDGKFCYGNFLIHWWEQS